MSTTSQKGMNTPYDSAFKSIIRKCPRLALFLVNEMFYKRELIDEEYDGTERIEFLDKALPDLTFGNLEMDSRFAVYKTTRRVFHLECQSTPDGKVILRMLQYDTRSALDEAELGKNVIHMKMDDSGVIWLRSSESTPKVMEAILDVPQGGSVTYQIPAIKMQDYSLDYLIENNLFILLPFLFFNYEKQLEKTPVDPVIYHEVLILYDTILKKLKELGTSGVLTVYEASTLYDALKAVFEALGETNKAEQEVQSIMGGMILEFSADKYYDAGKADGVTIGEKKGEKKFAKLAKHLLSIGNTEELLIATEDEKYRTFLYQKYAIA